MTPREIAEQIAIHNSQYIDDSAGWRINWGRATISA